MVDVSTRAFVVRSVATFTGLAGTVVAIVWVRLMVGTTVAIGGSCEWIGPYDDGTPPCPPGMATIGVATLVGGAISLVVYVRAGLRVGPRLGVLAWPACFGPMFWVVFDRGLHPDGGGTDYGMLWALPETVAFVLLPAIPVVLSRRARREVFWSDGRGLLTGDDAPPVPPAGFRPKAWSAAVQAVAIVVGVWIATASYPAVVVPPLR